jgi:hypothetical protein
LFAAHYVDCIEFAALDTLQYGLTRHAKRAHRFPHWHKAITDFIVEAGHEVIGQEAERGARAPQKTLASMPSEAKTSVELLDQQIADHRGQIGSPFRAVDTLLSMERRGTITRALRNA